MIRKNAKKNHAKDKHIPKDKHTQYARLVAQESLIFDVTEEISRVLKQDGVSRSELAERLGKSKGFITQVLGGDRNMTLRTVADLGFALDRRFDVRAVPAVEPLPRPQRPYHGAGGAHAHGFASYEDQIYRSIVHLLRETRAPETVESDEPDREGASAEAPDHEFTLAA